MSESPPENDEFSVARAAAEAPRHPFVVDAEGHAHSFAYVAEAVRPRVESLSGKRLGMLVASPSLACLFDIVALLEARVPFVALHPRSSTMERTRARLQTAPDVLLDQGTLTSTQSGDPLPTTISPSTLAVLFTSGTSGPARGVVLSRRAFSFAVAASAARLGWRRDDRWMLTLPLAHVGGLSVLLRCLAARKTVVLAPQGPFAPRDFVARLEHQSATIVSLVPTQLERICTERLIAPKLLRIALIGGAACPAEVLERALELGWPVRTTYGCTEMASQIATAEHTVRSMRDGCGRPLRGVDVQVRNGRIFVRSGAAMDGWLDPNLPSPFDEEGFYDTGDLGRLDERGRLHIFGRADDVIVTGGENVHPWEVEQALLAFPEIEAACVVGMPDRVWGERVTAVIVARHGAPDDATLRDLLRPLLSSFKLPRQFVRVSSLPTNENGKVSRRAVRAKLLEEMSLERGQ